MINSKAWNWAEITEPFWSEPSEDVYYYVHRWKKKGLNTFLDLGCGIGRHSIMFAQNGFTVFSLDLSKSGIDKLKKMAYEKNLKIKCDISDMKKLPYEDEMFDCILAYHSIYHADTESMVQIISEIRRVLKQQGEIYMTFNSKNSPSFNDPRHTKLDSNSIVKEVGDEKGIPHYFADEDDIRNLLKGFYFISLRQIQDIYEDGVGWHYFTLVKKQ